MSLIRIFEKYEDEKDDLSSVRPVENDKMQRGAVRRFKEALRKADRVNSVDLKTDYGGYTDLSGYTQTLEISYRVLP